MDKNTLLVKTEKGRDAMARRAPELVPRLRSLLILVDGKRSVSELDKLGAGLGGGAELLQQLIAQGWVEARDSSLPFKESSVFVDSQPPPAASTKLSDSVPTAVEPTPSVKESTLPFADARRLAIRFVNDALGPMGEQTAMRIESCKTAAELQAQLPRIRDALKNFRGISLVQSFDLDVVPKLPRL